MHGVLSHCVLLLSVALAVLTASLSPVKAEEYSEALAAGKRITVIRVDLTKEKLQLFLHDDADQPLKSFDGVNLSLQTKDSRLRFAMNAGMYHGDFSPVGLYVAEGVEIAALNLQPGDGNFFLKPNGVFAITDRGARVIESSLYPRLKQSETVQLATQSGPLLLAHGKIHPVFNPQSTSRLYRNGVGVHSQSPNQVLFAISEEPVNFHEFATFFRDGLKCTDALFLDGTICSLYSRKLKRSDKKMDLGPIIGITEAAPTSAN